MSNAISHPPQGNVLTMPTGTWKERRVAVLMGGLSAEREVSLESGTAILAALQRRGYQATGIDVDRFVCRQLLAQGAEVVFIGLHGRYGEDGCIQGMLEAMQLPYTGSSVAASALAMDKVMSKRLFVSFSWPTAEWCYPATVASVSALGLPVVVKPRNEGSSVGLTVVRHPEAIEPALQKAGALAGRLAERYIAGRELSVGVVGSGDQARCLGTMEIRPADGLYDYEAKYKREDTAYLVPAPVPESVQVRITELALAVHRGFDCSGATRTDFIWDGQGEPLLLEINTLPGMTSHSLLPKLAAWSGMSYDDLVEAILDDASVKASSR